MKTPTLNVAKGTAGFVCVLRAALRSHYAIVRLDSFSAAP